MVSAKVFVHHLLSCFCLTTDLSFLVEVKGISLENYVLSENIRGFFIGRVRLSLEFMDFLRDHLPDCWREKIYGRKRVSGSQPLLWEVRGIFGATSELLVEVQNFPESVCWRVEGMVFFLLLYCSSLFFFFLLLLSID